MRRRATGRGCASGRIGGLNFANKKTGARPVLAKLGAGLVGASRVNVSFRLGTDTIRRGVSVRVAERSARGGRKPRQDTLSRNRARFGRRRQAGIGGKPARHDKKKNISQVVGIGYFIYFDKIKV